MRPRQGERSHIFERAKAANATAVIEALDAFDIVGYTEKFDEALLILADMVGLQHTLYKYGVKCIAAWDELREGGCLTS